MTVESKSSVIPAVATTLTEAASAFRGTTQLRPKAAAVVSALLEAEKAAKQQKLTYPLESLLGNWRLCFVTTAKVKEQSGIVKGRGWYLPKIFIKAHISFSQPGEMLVEKHGAAAIGNQLEVGAFTLKLTGPALYVGKKNRNRSGGAPAAHHPKRSLRIKCFRSRRELTINERTNSLDY